MTEDEIEAEEIKLISNTIYQIFSLALKRGYESRKRGEASNTNPYHNWRTAVDNGVNASRALHAAWQKGWLKADDEEKLRIEGRTTESKATGRPAGPSLKNGWRRSKEEPAP